MELDKITINTTSQEGQSVQTTANLGDINFSSVLQEVPQIQTTIQDNIATISSVINAPWVNVTSVNGMTGDIIIDPVIRGFTSNTRYIQDSIISRSGKLWSAKETFTSGNTFDSNDWIEVISTGGASTWDEIEDKPTFANVSFSGSYTDLSNTPSLATVATSGSYIDLSNTPNLANVALSGEYSDLSNTPNLSTVAISGSYSDLSNKPANLVTYDTTLLTSVEPWVGTSVIQDNAITSAKILDGSITSTKILNGAVTTDKISLLSVLASHIKLTANTTADANGWRSIKLADNVTMYWQNYSFTPTMTANQWTAGTGKSAPVGITGTIFGTASGNCGDRAIAVTPWITATGGIDVGLQNKSNGSVTSACRINAIVFSIT